MINILSHQTPETARFLKGPSAELSFESSKVTTSDPGRNSEKRTFNHQNAITKPKNKKTHIIEYGISSDYHLLQWNLSITTT